MTGSSPSGRAARLLALDVGDARIGVAAGELGSPFAFGRGFIIREGVRRDVAAVLRALEEEGGSLIVVGLPLRLDGTDSPQTTRVRAFADALATEAPEGARVVLEDERLTTKIAQRQVGSSALPLGKRQEKGRLDEAAAVLILESYLTKVREQPTPQTGGAGERPEGERE